MNNFHKSWEFRWPWPCLLISSTLWIPLKKCSCDTNQIYQQQKIYIKKLYFLTWSILLYSSAVNRILTNICLLWEYCLDKHLFLHCTTLHHIAIQYTVLQCYAQYWRRKHFPALYNTTLDSTSPNCAATTIWLTIWIQRPARYSACRSFGQVISFT